MSTNALSTVEPLPLARRTAPGRSPSVAVIGLGYVGLPTALALHDAGSPVIGIDTSPERLQAIRDGDVDALPEDHGRLARALAADHLDLTADTAAQAEADVVMICVPTPVDSDRRPDARAVERACAGAVAHARPGQTLLLTSTTFVGTTRTLLADPLAARGLQPGRDVFVAFAPERILPGDASVQQRDVPRVVGGVTPACAAAAAKVLQPIVDRVHTVSSPEAAELTKLHENTFRAVNHALANEMAGAARHFGLDPVEIVDAAATKPYGFLAHYPGPGVGGHCIPVDPHWLLEPLRTAGVRMPLSDRALTDVAARPAAVVARAEQLLAGLGVAADAARVLIVGMAYKPGVADGRESPAHAIAEQLARRGAEVEYVDALVPEVIVDGRRLRSHPAPAEVEADLVILAVVHPGFDLDWLGARPDVLDATYRTPAGLRRHLV
jgi:nucleotide sugar dehydrogenase